MAATRLPLRLLEEKVDGGRVRAALSRGGKNTRTLSRAVDPNLYLFRMSNKRFFFRPVTRESISLKHLKSAGKGSSRRTKFLPQAVFFFFFSIFSESFILLGCAS